MKHIKLLLTLLLFCISFSSCNTNSKATDNAETVYQCPMKCEEEKTFVSMGSCSVCKMDLKALENTSSKELSNDEISDESIFNLTS